MSSPGAPSGCAEAFARAAAVPKERQPEDQELVEREPRAAHLCLGERSRSVNHRERVRAQRQALRREHGRGQVVSDVADELERLGVDVAERLLRDILGRGVDGRQVPVSASPSRSYEDTAKPCRLARPRMRSDAPGTSFASSHGWLNHVALISPVSSATFAVRIFSRPRRRLDASGRRPR